MLFDKFSYKSFDLVDTKFDRKEAARMGSSSLPPPRLDGGK